jgi:hypothetical protein
MKNFAATGTKAFPPQIEGWKNNNKNFLGIVVLADKEKMQKLAFSESIEKV